MLESILYHSTNHRNDSFKGSYFIKGSWCSILLGALNDKGIDSKDLDILPNNRKLKGATKSEILYYKGSRVLTFRNDKSVSANDVIKVFQKKGFIAK